MLGEVLQPALSKALNEAVANTVVENMPPITENITIDGMICLSIDKKTEKQIIIKIHDTIEPRKNAWQDTGSGRSSPWQIPLEKIQAAQQRFLNCNGQEEEFSNSDSPDAPVDLRATPTREHAGKTGAKNNLTNGNSDIDEKVENAAQSRQTPVDIKCKVCSKTIHGGLPALQTHTQEAHRRHVCRFCYSSFSLRSNLKRHERLHVGLKPYKCKSCSKSFARSTDLKLHMQKHGISGEENAVPCTQCSRTFQSVQNLRWHLYKVHKETEATFACTICEKLFDDKNDYVKHREDHTNNLIHNGASSNATTESMEYDIEVNSFADDSDSEQLMIDTQSEGTEEEDISLPNLRNPNDNSNDAADVALELTSESPTGEEHVSKSPLVVQTDINARRGETATPTPSQCSTGSQSGSRKRKKKNPTRIIEIIDDNYNDEEADTSNMYFNAAAVKAKRKENGGTQDINSAAINAFSQEEPENLVIRPRYKSPSPPPAHRNHSMASNALSQIAQTIHQNFGAKNSPLMPQLQQVGLRNLMTPPYQQTVIGNTVISPQNIDIPTPILITPERYQPKPQNNSSYHRPSNKPKQIATTPTTSSSTPVSKSKIENITNESVDENKEYPCVEVGCNETYLGFSAYEDHCMIRHGRYPCKYCKQTFSGKNNRTRHMRCHLGAKTYTCPDCNKTFSRPDSMREHQFIHTLSYQEDRCRNCGSAYDKKNLLLAHLKQCYRHKMETGKSTKFIDETPQYAGAQDASKKVNGQIDESLAPLKPIKLESIPAFRHIAPALDRNVPSPQMPLVGTVFSLAEARSSPTMPKNVTSAKNTSLTLPVTLSGGPLPSLPAPINIPTMVSNSSVAFPSPLVIMPSAGVSTAALLAASAAHSITTTSNNSIAASPLLARASANTKVSEPVVISPEIDSSVPAPLVVAQMVSTASSSAKKPSAISTPILAASLAAAVTKSSNSASPSPAVSPRATSPANGSVFPSPTEESQSIDVAKDSSALTPVLDAVKGLVNKRKADESRDQNANTKKPKSDDEADEEAKSSEEK